MNVQTKQEKETVEVEILGEPYTLKSEASPDYTRQVAEHVDRTASEIREEGGGVDQKRLAILTALAITDQLFRERDGAEQLQGEVERRADRIREDVLRVVGNAPVE